MVASDIRCQRESIKQYFKGQNRCEGRSPSVRARGRDPQATQRALVLADQLLHWYAEQRCLGNSPRQRLAALTAGCFTLSFLKVKVTCVNGCSNLWDFVENVKIYAIFPQRRFVVTVPTIQKELKSKADFRQNEP